MEEVGNDPVYFCYFNINNRTEMIIGSVLLFLSVLLIGDAFRKYFKLRGSHNSNVNFIYRMIFAWWISNYAISQPMSPQMCSNSSYFQ